MPEINKTEISDQQLLYIVMLAYFHAKENVLQNIDDYENNSVKLLKGCLENFKTLMTDRSFLEQAMQYCQEDSSKIDINNMNTNCLKQQKDLNTSKELSNNMTSALDECFDLMSFIDNEYKNFSLKSDVKFLNHRATQGILKQMNPDINSWEQIKHCFVEIRNFFIAHKLFGIKEIKSNKMTKKEESHKWRTSFNTMKTEISSPKNLIAK